jgi:hypothetical protein
MSPAREAVSAMTANDMAFSAHHLPGKKVLHVGANFDNFADELVADDHRHGNGLLRPFIPFIDVNIGAANAGAVDADENVVDADFGLGNLLKPESGFRFSFY